MGGGVGRSVKANKGEGGQEGVGVHSRVRPPRVYLHLQECLFMFIKVQATSRLHLRRLSSFGLISKYGVKKKNQSRWTQSRSNC